MAAETREFNTFSAPLRRLTIVLVLAGLAFALLNGVWNVWMYSLVKPLPHVMEGVEIKGREVLIQLLIASYMGGLGSIIFCLKSLSEPCDYSGRRDGLGLPVPSDIWSGNGPCIFHANKGRANCLHRRQRRVILYGRGVNGAGR